MIDGEPEDVVLGLLANTPTSFAALFGLVSRESRRRLSTKALFELVSSLEAKGWVRVIQLAADGSPRRATQNEFARALTEYTEWLDHASDAELTPSELSFDEIGIWIEITSEGRREFDSRQTDGEHEKWTLSQDDRARTVTIEAQDVAIAQRIARDWEARNPNLSVVEGSRVIDNHLEHAREDGSRGRQLVRLRFAYDSR